MRTLFLAIALLAGVSTTQAQVFQHAQEEKRSSHSYISDASEMVAPGVKPYVKAGVVSADYVGKNTGGIKGLWRLMAEAGLQIPFKTRCFGLQMGLRYIQKGARGPWKDDTKDMADIHQNLLEVPLLVTMFMPTDKKGGMKVGMGCFASYGVGGKVVHGAHEYNTYGFPGFDMRRFDIGPMLELGYETRHLSVTFGAETGAFDVHEKMGDAHARAFYLTAGYIF